MQRMRIKSFILGFLLLVSWTTIGIAAEFPEKPIRLIIPWSAGAGNDLTARTFQPFLEKVLGQRILIDNIPAGTTKVGTMELMKAKPDGYTLLYTTAESWVGFYYSKTYDSKIWEQLVPIGNITYSPFGFVEVRVESPYKTWADLVKAAKEKPGKLTCGGAGAGGMTELIMHDITKASGVKTVYVPFAGAAKSGAALYGGHTDFRMTQPVNASAMIKAGKSRGLAVSSEKRLVALPDVPTFKELGIGGTITMCGGFWGPPKVPTNIVSTLTKMIEKATKETEFVKIVQQRAQGVEYRSPEQVRGDLQNYDKEFGPKLSEAYK
jgi:tripartite-type tricarboxylate transporter receptor subunit TctC